MSDLKKHFGLKLKTLRNNAKITQEQMADSVDVTIETISNIERGIFGPRFDTLEKIASALKVPVKDLFDFSN